MCLVGKPSCVMTHRAPPAPLLMLSCALASPASQRGLSCQLYVLIERLKLNKKKSEIQMLVSKLIGNRMRL